MRVAIYVSNEAHRDAAVLKKLRDRAQWLHWQQQIVEYVENRPNQTGEDAVFDQLMADARRKEFDVLVVRELQELGNNSKDLFQNLAALDACRIRLRITSLAIDTQVPGLNGKTLVRLLKAFEAIQHNAFRNRVRAGVAAARRNGRCPGPPARAFPHEVARALRKAGKSWRETARQLGIPTTTLRDALTRLDRHSLQP